METKLVYFGTTYESQQGTIRGTISIILLIILNLVWLSLTKKMYKKYFDVKEVSKLNMIIGYSLALFVLGSALSIQNEPKSLKVSVVFGALVGFVVYGFANGVYLAVNKDYDLSIVVIDTIWGVVSSAIITAVLYYIFWNKK